MPDGSRLQPEWTAATDRRQLWDTMRQNAKIVHAWLRDYCPTQDATELGLSISFDSPESLYMRHRKPTVEVHSVRLARRVTESGEPINDIVIEILQRRRGYLDRDRQGTVDREGTSPDDRGDFTFRGGCTLLVNPADGEIRYAINKHILSNYRLDMQRRFFSGETSGLRATYFGAAGVGQHLDEPFSLLHRPLETMEEDR